MDKPKFNKRKCLKCKYHSAGFGVPIRDGDKQLRVHCNYSATGKTCLRKTENGIIDTRGDDYNHCKLYVKGKVIEEEMIE